MKNRIIAVLFVIAIAAIALFVIHEQYFSVEKKETAVSKIVIPQVQKQVEDETQEELQIGTEEGVSSLVPLKSDETLFGTLSMDFDGDGYDDQVNAIKNSSSPAMQLLVGLEECFKNIIPKKTYNCSWYARYKNVEPKYKNVCLNPCTDTTLC